MTEPIETPAETPAEATPEPTPEPAPEPTGEGYEDPSSGAIRSSLPIPNPQKR